MILHIVRSGENIKVIADNYQCEISDITSNNLHITDFKNLKAGMKLKIPFLTKPILETLEETESFISDYYPSLKQEFNEVKDKEEKVKEDIKEEVKEEKKIVVEKQPQVKYNGYYSGNIIPNLDSRFIKKI